ncbi:hypothetical protein P3471_24100, partial [Vibrio parahaemolyticus]|nr:hypothetical protein [Vibrio parahaemolyticus]
MRKKLLDPLFLVMLAPAFAQASCESVIEEIKQKVSGTSDWKGHVTINLPDSAKEKVNLQIDVTAGLKQLQSQLPALNSQLLAELGQINVQAKGDTEQLTIGGDIGKRLGFNTVWNLSDKPLRLVKAHIAPWQNQAPELPKNTAIVVSLPPVKAMDWDKLAGLLVSSNSSQGGVNIR